MIVQIAVQTQGFTVISKAIARPLSTIINFMIEGGNA